MAEKGFDPQYGARPLKRLIQNEILNMLAMEMVKGNIKAGDTVHLDMDDEKIIIKKPVPSQTLSKEALMK